MEVIIDGIRYIPVREEATIKQPFNELIRAARKHKRESLEEASRNIGTVKSHLWELEKARCVPNLILLQAILSYYSIKFEDIEQYGLTSRRTGIK